jgi:hypothetical protein
VATSGRRRTRDYIRRGISSQRIRMCGHPGVDLVGGKVEPTVDDLRNGKTGTAAPSPKGWRTDIEFLAQGRASQPPALLGALLGVRQSLLTKETLGWVINGLPHVHLAQP